MKYHFDVLQLAGSKSRMILRHQYQYLIATQYFPSSLLEQKESRFASKVELSRCVSQIPDIMIDVSIMLVK